MRLPILLAALAALALAAAGCADEPSPTQEADGADDPGAGEPMHAPQTHEAVMRGNRFEPADLTVHVGDTVHWTTEDPQRHNVVSDSAAASFRSPDVSTVPLPVYESEYSYTFGQAGTVEYLCEYHAGMTGTITVLDGAAAPAPPHH